MRKKERQWLWDNYIYYLVVLVLLCALFKGIIHQKKLEQKSSLNGNNEYLRLPKNKVFQFVNQNEHIFCRILVYKSYDNQNYVIVDTIDVSPLGSIIYKEVK